MTFDEFVTAAIAYYQRHGEQRFGQACMNALRWCNEVVYKRVSLDIWEECNPQSAAVFAWFVEVQQNWNE